MNRHKSAQNSSETSGSVSQRSLKFLLRLAALYSTKKARIRQGNAITKSLLNIDAAHDKPSR